MVAERFTRKWQVIYARQKMAQQGKNDNTPTDQDIDIYYTCGGKHEVGIDQIT